MLMLKVMVMVLASLVAVYSLGLFCILWDDRKEDTPTWMYRYLNFIFPRSGWDEEMEETEKEED